MIPRSSGDRFRVQSLQKQRLKKISDRNAVQLLVSAVLNDKTLEDNPRDHSEDKLSEELYSSTLQTVKMLQHLNLKDLSPEKRNTLKDALKTATCILNNQDRLARVPVKARDKVGEVLEEFIKDEILEIGDEDILVKAEDVYIKFREWIYEKSNSDVITTSIKVTSDCTKKDSDFYFQMQRRGFLTTKKGKPSNCTKFIGIRLKTE